MKHTSKYYKDRNFDANSNISVEIRVDDLKKLKQWTGLQRKEAVDFLEKFKEQIEIQIHHINKIS